VNFWILTHEARHDPSHHVHTDVENRRDPDCSSGLGCHLRYGGLRLVESGKGSRGLLVVRMSRIGEMEAAGCPLEQTHAQIVLEPRDASADAGFRKSEGGRRPGEASGFDHTNENRDPVQVWCCQRSNSLPQDKALVHGAEHPVPAEDLLKTFGTGGGRRLKTFGTGAGAEHPVPAEDLLKTFGTGGGAPAQGRRAPAAGAQDLWHRRRRGGGRRGGGRRAPAAAGAARPPAATDPAI